MTDVDPMPILDVGVGRLNEGYGPNVLDEEDEEDVLEGAPPPLLWL